MALTTAELLPPATSDSPKTHKAHPTFHLTPLVRTNILQLEVGVGVHGVCPCGCLCKLCV